MTPLKTATTWSPNSPLQRTSTLPTDTVSQQVQDNVNLSGGESDDFFRRMQQLKEKATVTRTQSLTTSWNGQTNNTTLVNGKPSAPTNRPENDPNQYGGSVTYTDKTRAELNTETTVFGRKVTSNTYAEKSTTGNAILTGSVDENGRVNGEGGTGFSQSYKVGNETTVELAEGYIVSRQVEASVNSNLKANGKVALQDNKKGFEQTLEIDTVASSDARLNETVAVQTPFGNGAMKTEAKVAADAHFQVTNKTVIQPKRLELGVGVDVSNEVSAGGKRTFELSTSDKDANERSSISFFTESSVSEGFSAKVNRTFVRDDEKGETTLSVGAGGPIPVAPWLGVGAGFEVKVKDKDIEGAVRLANPLLGATGLDKPVAGAIKTGLQTIVPAANKALELKRKAVTVIKNPKPAMRKLRQEVNTQAQRIRQSRPVKALENQVRAVRNTEAYQTYAKPVENFVRENAPAAVETGKTVLKYVAPVPYALAKGAYNYLFGQ